MEHSALHALLLCGMAVTLGGVLAMWWFIRPSARALNMPVDPELSKSIEWLVMAGAVIGVVATACDFFVQAAEIDNRTIFGGTDLKLVLRFVADTTVGRLDLARGAFLLFAALSVRLARRCKWTLTGLSAFAAVILASLV